MTIFANDSRVRRDRDGVDLYEVSAPDGGWSVSPFELDGQWIAVPDGSNAMDERRRVFDTVDDAIGYVLGDRR